MKQYSVIWQIDIEADSDQEAALKALRIQRDPESCATIFEVTDKDSGKQTTVDLLDTD